MQVFVHQLDGKVATADPSQFNSLEAMLATFQSENCRAVYQGSHINSLDDLVPNSNIYITADLSGGKRKRKKKVYTTKKKNKHIHKRVKLSFLNLYSVDSNSFPIQKKVKSQWAERFVLIADQESSWHNIGIVITADSVIPLSRWTQKLSRRTNKS